MDGFLIFAFMVGAVSSVNPCGFALLPAFFARRVGIETETTQHALAGAAAGVSAGAAAGLGVILAFAIVGGAVTAGVSWMGDALPWAGLAVGVILIGVAVYVLAGRHIGLRIPLPASWQRTSGYRGDFLFGVGYGVASLSCTLPIFLSVTAIATTGSLAASFGSFLAFGLGMSTVIVAIAVAAGLSRNGLAAIVKRLLPYANRFGGVVLLLAGLYVVVYWGSALFSADPADKPDIVTRGNRLSGQLVSIVGSDAGKLILIALSLVFVGALTWLIWRHRKNRAAPAAASLGATKGDNLR